MFTCDSGDDVLLRYVYSQRGHDVLLVYVNTEVGHAVLLIYVYNLPCSSIVGMLSYVYSPIERLSKKRCSAAVCLQSKRIRCSAAICLP